MTEITPEYLINHPEFIRLTLARNQELLETEEPTASAPSSVAFLKLVNAMCTLSEAFLVLSDRLQKLQKIEVTNEWYKETLQQWDYLHTGQRGLVNTVVEQIKKEIGV